MQVNASDLQTLYRPSLCELRVYLRQRGEPAESPSPFEEVLRRLGERHERDHLRELGPYLDLSGLDLREAATRTEEALARGKPLIYQGALRATTTLAGAPCDIIGRPDFLLREGNGYLVRDAKIARRINARDHPEILLQLQAYGWLFEQTSGRPPVGLQVFSGASDIVPVPQAPSHQELEELARIRALQTGSQEPVTPVGWSKCGHCGYRGRCWTRAVEAKDVALIPEVDQGLVQELHRLGVRTIDELLARFDEASLAALQRSRGTGRQRVGRAAGRIIRSAQVLSTGRPIVLRPPDLPEEEHWAIFDVEGLPPQLDQLDRVYLWGLQVFSRDESPYLGAFADPGPESDRRCWDDFLQAAESIFLQYGDIPFLHWHSYERVKLDTYINRYGDPDGVAARVRAQLLDLLPVTKKAVVLPVYSYSLKQVEQYIGFRRTQEEVGGNWAMAAYIEAVETDDHDARDRLLGEIRTYNEEDLQATWAVLRWLKSLRP